MRLVICDDHRVLVDSLGELFESRGHAVHRTTSPPDAVCVVSAQRPEACLMDVAFPDANGVDFIPAMLQASETTSVVVLTGCLDAALEDEAIRRGAAFCATKSDDLDAFVSTVESLPLGDGARGPRRPPSRVSEQVSTFDVHPLARFLTARERDVLVGLVTGESTTSLGDRLAIGPATVRTHIQGILTKLGVHSRVEAVAFSIRERLVSPATMK